MERGPLTRRRLLVVAAAAAVAHGCGEGKRDSGDTRARPALRLDADIAATDTPLVDVAFDPHGRTIYCTDDAGAVRTLAPGATKSRVIGETEGRLWALAVRSDGAIAYGGEAGGVAVRLNGESRSRVWSTASGVLDLAWAPDGRTLAVGLQDATVALLTGGRASRRLRGLPLDALGVAWSPAGALVAGGSYGAEGRVWDPRDGKTVARLVYPEDDDGADMNGICWVDDHSVVTASQDGRTRLWDARDGRLIRRLSEFVGWARPVVLSADGKYLAQSGLEGRINVTEPSSGRRIATATTNDVSVWGLAWSPGRPRLVAACGDGHVRSFSLTRV